MSDEINYKNNPLHGVSLKKMLTEIVEHYGFEILFAYLNINCFRKNPSIPSSVKFLKKTDWAREKVEAFYLYEFKNLPHVSSEQFKLSPRDRIVPEDQKPGEPAVLSLEDAERVREKRDKKAAAYNQGAGRRSNTGKYSGASRGRDSSNRDIKSARKDKPEPPRPKESSSDRDADPWAKWKEKNKGVEK